MEDVTYHEKRPLKVGDRIIVIGGYSMDPRLIGRSEGSRGRVFSFIPGQNEQPAAVVELDDPIQVGGVSGKFVVLELRYVEASWTSGESVYVELCDFAPESKPWAERKKGTIVERRAAFEILHTLT